MKIRTALFAAAGLKKAIAEMENNLAIDLKPANPAAKAYFEKCHETDVQGIKEVNELIRKLLDEAADEDKS